MASDLDRVDHHRGSTDWVAGLWRAEDAQLLHVLGERLANSREWPNWSSDSEFRAIRDRSAGDRSDAAPATAPKKGERG